MRSLEIPPYMLELILIAEKAVQEQDAAFLPWVYNLTLQIEHESPHALGRAALCFAIYQTKLR